jgi:hypothetical protein
LESLLIFTGVLKAVELDVAFATISTPADKRKTLESKTVKIIVLLEFTNRTFAKGFEKSTRWIRFKKLVQKIEH